VKIYRTVQGDTWDLIALKMYPDLGREMQMSFLLRHNPDHAETVIFPANVRLRIPEANIPTVEDLPPWKRG